MAKQLCYQCFQHFKQHEVWFRCENTAPQEDPTEACPHVLDPKIKKRLHRPFPLHGLTSALTSQFTKPKHCKCDHCGVLSRTRICPHCHWTLPVEHGDLAEHIIAVVGISSSGKSHYFTALIERELNAGSAIGRAFGASADPADSETETRFRDEYYTPLFLKGQVIEPTRADREHKRLIFNVVVKNLACRLTFVFFDIAGERLNAAADDAAANARRYLWNASGIIYLVNPKDVKEWQAYQTEPASRRTQEAGDIFNGLALAYRKELETGTGKTLKIPLAICISQFDRLRARRVEAGLPADLFDPATTPIQGGRIDHAKIERESQVLRDFMQKSGGTAAKLVTGAEQRFDSPRFFAASALGDSPDAEGNISEIQPCRVGVPFFWILSRLGVGKAGRG